MNQNLNELAARIHKQNHNWWHDITTGAPIERNKGELLMLVVTELAEAVEGIRKNLMDDKLPHRRMEEVEMADAFIRLLDFAGGFDIQIDEKINDIVRDDGNRAESILEICLYVTRIKYYGDSWLSATLGMIDCYCRIHQLDLYGAIREKLEYNRTRADHSIEQRKLANGKKF